MKVYNLEFIDLETNQVLLTLDFSEITIKQENKIERARRLFSHLFYKDTNLEIPNGWTDLVYSMVDELSIYSLIKIHTIKQKFGELRCYFDFDIEDPNIIYDFNTRNEIYAIIEKYENLALNTCEFCGQNPAKIRTNKSWIVVLCDNCNNK